MSYRDDWLRGRLRSYLARRTVPRGFEGKEDSLKAEANALVECVLRKAPRDGFEDWWNAVERVLAEEAKTRAWPTEGEITEAARSVRGIVGKTVSQGDELDPVHVAADRMNSGDSVGEHWLYGVCALDLEESGLVSAETMRRHRSAWYFAMKDTYGEDVARATEDDRKSKHDRAKTDRLAERKRRNVEIPNKRVEAAE